MCTCLCCGIPVPVFDHTASRPYKGPEMQSSLQIATGWQTWGKWGKERRAADLSKFTGSACSEHLTEDRELPPECPAQARREPFPLPLLRQNTVSLSILR